MKKILLLTAFAILVPLVLFGFLGCMKKPDHTPDYGPQVSFEDIQKTAADNVPPDPMTIKLGRYISIDVTQVIDTQSPMTLSQKLDTVTAYNDTPTEIQWTFEVTMNELGTDGVWKKSIQNFDLVYEKNNKQSQASTFESPAQTKMSSYSLKALQTSDTSSPVKVTYHNLKREDGFMPVPLLVKNRPDCGGVPNCDNGLRYIQISFDRVVWDSEDHGNKTHYTITYSPDIPAYVADWSHPDGIYLTNQIKFCAQTWIEIEGNGQKQVVPVQQCADMRDFHF